MNCFHFEYDMTIAIESDSLAIELLIQWGSYSLGVFIISHKTFSKTKGKFSFILFWFHSGDQILFQPLLREGGGGMEYN